MFHTLKYAKILQDVGFSKDQAETSVEILLEIMQDKLATKDDLKILKSELTIRMGAMFVTAVGALTAIIALLSKLSLI